MLIARDVREEVVAELCDRLGWSSKSRVAKLLRNSVNQPTVREGFARCGVRLVLDQKRPWSTNLDRQGADALARVTRAIVPLVSHGDAGRATEGQLRAAVTEIYAQADAVELARWVHESGSGKFPYRLRDVLIEDVDAIAYWPSLLEGKDLPAGVLSKDAVSEALRRLARNYAATLPLIAEIRAIPDAALAGTLDAARVRNAGRPPRVGGAEATPDALRAYAIRHLEQEQELEEPEWPVDVESFLAASADLLLVGSSALPEALVRLVTGPIGPSGLSDDKQQDVREDAIKFLEIVHLGFRTTDPARFSGWLNARAWGELQGSPQEYRRQFELSQGRPPEDDDTWDGLLVERVVDAGAEGDLAAVERVDQLARQWPRSLEQARRDLPGITLPRINDALVSWFQEDLRGFLDNIRLVDAFLDPAEVADRVLQACWLRASATVGRELSDEERRGIQLTLKRSHALVLAALADE